MTSIKGINRINRRIAAEQKDQADVREKVVNKKNQKKKQKQKKTWYSVDE